MDDIIKAAREARNKRQAINEREDAAVKSIARESTKRMDKLRDTLRAAQNAVYDEEQRREEDTKAVRENADAQRKELRPALDRHARILKMMRIISENIGPHDFTITPSLQYWAEKFEKPRKLATLYNDDTAIVEAWVIPQHKPTNKYALAVLGRSIFGDRYAGDVYDYPYSYGINGIHDEGLNIRVIIAERPTVAEIEAYFARNHAKAADAWNPGEHAQLVQEYRWTQEHTNTDEWRIEFLQERKRYFEEEYSRGEEQPEYKAVVRELKKLGVKA